jgi:hypothetical protein
MRQQPAYSKADLVARGAQPATDNTALASNPFRVLAAADENIVVGGFARYIRSANFADRTESSDGVCGARPAWSATILPQRRAVQID